MVPEDVGEDLGRVIHTHFEIGFAIKVIAKKRRQEESLWRWLQIDMEPINT